MFYGSAGFVSQCLEKDGHLQKTLLDEPSVWHIHSCPIRFPHCRWSQLVSAQSFPLVRRVILGLDHQPCDAPRCRTKFKLQSSLAFQRVLVGGGFWLMWGKKSQFSHRDERDEMREMKHICWTIRDVGIIEVTRRLFTLTETFPRASNSNTCSPMKTPKYSSAVCSLFFCTLFQPRYGPLLILSSSEKN